MLIRHTTRRSAQRAMDAQRVNGFCVEVGPQNHTAELGRYFVSHPTPGMWMLNDRTRDLNDPAAWGAIRQVLDAVFGAVAQS